MIVAKEITQLLDQVKMSIISKLTNGISRVLKQFYTYFNGTVISTNFILSAAGVFPVLLTINLSYYFL